MEDKIRGRLEEIRSFLQADGGDLEIISIEGKKITVRLVGACGSCPHAMITLKDGIEKDLKKQVDPEIEVFRAE